jgi:hypothetical protein
MLLAHPTNIIYYVLLTIVLVVAELLDSRYHILSRIDAIIWSVQHLCRHY